MVFHVEPPFEVYSNFILSTKLDVQVIELISPAFQISLPVFGEVTAKLLILNDPEIILIVGSLFETNRIFPTVVGILFGIFHK